MIATRQWSVWLVLSSVGSSVAVAQFVASDSVSPKPETAGVLRLVNVPQSVPLARIESINAGIAELRRLLAMSHDERERTLAKKEEDKRSYLRKRLEEYDAMSKEDREAELQSLRLFRYLRELVKLTPEIRQAALAIIPEMDREMVENRLRRWDKLPPDLQAGVMENERIIRYVLQLEGLNRQQQQALIQSLPESLRVGWDQRLEKWHDLPSERREEIYLQFKRIFSLTAKERTKVLETLSQQERAQAEKTLKIVQALEKLSPAERDACVDAFLSFIETPPKSDEYYLRLQEMSRWERWSPTEQALYKRVIQIFPPFPGKQPPLPGSPEALQGVTNLLKPALPGTIANEAPSVDKPTLAPKKVESR